MIMMMSCWICNPLCTVCDAFFVCLSREWPAGIK